MAGTRRVRSFRGGGKKNPAIPVESVRASAPFAYQGSVYSGIHGTYDGAKLMEAVQGASADATRVIANRVSGLRLRTYWERDEDGETVRRPTIDHPLQAVIDNPTLDGGVVTQSMGQILGMVVAQYLNAGESYLLVIHDDLGFPKNLYPMRPGSTQPIVEGGRITGYETQTSNMRTRKLRPRDVVRVWNPDPVDMFTAKGTLEKHAGAYNLNKYALETWQTFFKFDATPKLVLEARDGAEMLPNPDEREAFERSWRQRQSHLDGSALGTPLLVKPGWTAKELSSQNEASSGIEMIRFSRDLVLEAYGVSPAQLGDIENVNRSSAETTFYMFDRATIVPITDAIADALTNQLAMQFETPDRLNLRVAFEPFVDPDADFELKRDQTDAQLKIRSINEIRAQRQTPLDPAPWGELPIGQMQDVPYTGEVVEVDTSGIPLELPAVEAEEAEETAEAEDEDRNRSYHSLEFLRDHYEPREAWERAIREMQKWEPRFESRARSVTSRQESETVLRSREAGLASSAKDATKYRETIFPTEGNAWRRLFDETVEPVRFDLMVKAADEISKTLSGREYSFDEKGREMLREQARAYREDVNATTAKRLEELIERARSEKWDSKTFEEKVREMFGTRKREAKTQAHTEVGAAFNGGSLLGQEQTGIVNAIRWVSQFDVAVRATHWEATGEVSTERKPFNVGGFPARYPLDPRLPAQERANCRCVTVPVLEEVAALLED